MECSRKEVWSLVRFHISLALVCKDFCNYSTSLESFSLVWLLLGVGFFRMPHVFFHDTQPKVILSRANTNFFFDFLVLIAVVSELTLQFMLMVHSTNPQRGFAHPKVISDTFKLLNFQPRSLDRGRRANYLVIGTFPLPSFVCLKRFERKEYSSL